LTRFLLELAGYELNALQPDLAAVAVEVAEHRLDVGGLSQWLEKRAWSSDETPLFPQRRTLMGQAERRIGGAANGAEHVQHTLHDKKRLICRKNLVN
jgi:hypothetical protein